MVCLCIAVNFECAWQSWFSGKRCTRPTYYIVRAKWTTDESEASVTSERVTAGDRKAVRVTDMMVSLHPWKACSAYGILVNAVL